MLPRIWIRLTMNNPCLKPICRRLKTAGFARLCGYNLCKKGSIVELSLPTGFSSMQISTNSYHRWYSYRTGKTFRVNNPNKENVYDLLTPEHITVNNERPNYAYRFGNGYVVAPMYTYHSGKVVPYTMNFYYPTNEQFERWVGEIGSNTYRDNRWYMVACDVSSYNDFQKSIHLILLEML